MRAMRRICRQLVTAGAAGVVVILGAGLLPAPSAGAAPQGAALTQLQIVSGGHSFKAYGVAWTAAVNASLYTPTPSVTIGGVNVSVSRSTLAGTESHYWNLQVPGSSFTNKGGGSWLVAPASSTSPVLSMSVTFHPSTRVAERCKSGSAATYTGTLSGRLVLTSGLNKLGRVGADRWSFGTTTLYADYGCLPYSIKRPCRAGVLYGTAPTGLGSRYADVYGIQAGKTDIVSLTRGVTLSAPTNAYRFDYVTSSEPKATLRYGVLKVVTRTGALVRGSATFKGTGAKHTSYVCYEKGVKHTARVTIYSTVVFSSPGRLTGRTLLTGTLSSLKSAKHAYMSVTTIS